MKTFNIITLGASGAGKTVFLASLFKALSTQGKHSFFLEVEDLQKRQQLNAIYTKIITGDSWPSGTRFSEVNEWSYSCCVQNPETLDKYKACEFTYFDYAGGRLTNLDEQDTEFQNLVGKADSILGLLDGQKILACLNHTDKFKADSFVNHDLTNILMYMEKSQVPIHFVVSKWDLLHNKGYTLEDIRDYLLSIYEFNEIVRNRKAIDSPVRLIPVSSVGFEFATPQPDGSMQKKSDGVFRPFQPEVPLACVLIDAFKANKKEFEDAKKQLENQNLETENPWISIFQNIVNSGLNILLTEWFADFGSESLSILNKIDDILFAGYRGHKKGRLEELRKDRDNSLKEVENDITALSHAIDSFMHIEQKLDQDFPASNLFLL